MGVQHSLIINAPGHSQTTTGLNSSTIDIKHGDDLRVMAHTTLDEPHPHYSHHSTK